MKNQQSPLVSVLIPVFNCQDYIKETIQSVLEQTYTNLEVLIINDCSSDDTEIIINKFNDPRIRYFRNESNLKLIKTLNKGVSYATGEYLVRLDGDDICHPDRINRQVDFLLGNLDIALVGTDAWIIDEKNRIIKSTIMLPNTPAWTSFRLTRNSSLFHPSIMVRLDILKSLGGYDEAYPHAEDYALWLKMVSAGFTITNLPDRLIYYRIHSKSVSSIYKKQQYESSIKALRDFDCFGKFGDRYVFAKNLDDAWYSLRAFVLEPRKELFLYFVRLVFSFKQNRFKILLGIFKEVFQYSIIRTFLKLFPLKVKNGKIHLSIGYHE
ncbi:glycosyltransferase family 2 protein [Bdellovibrio sp. HCB290]|uniref:glycosyltransferase family 2 protein n=1 Tax=Bdellovibrio sp. HCB290 TaxID=3394356 RepID=UPI0039B3A6C2